MGRMERAKNSETFLSFAPFAGSSPLHPGLRRNPAPAILQPCLIVRRVKSRKPPALKTPSRAPLNSKNNAAAKWPSAPPSAASKTALRKENNGPGVGAALFRGIFPRLSSSLHTDGPRCVRHDPKKLPSSLTQSRLRHRSQRQPSHPGRTVRLHCPSPGCHPGRTVAGPSTDSAWRCGRTFITARGFRPTPSVLSCGWPIPSIRISSR